VFVLMSGVSCDHRSQLVNHLWIACEHPSTRPVIYSTLVSYPDTLQAIERASEVQQCHWNGNGLCNAAVVLD
jgi:hypothetical protein